MIQLGWVATCCALSTPAGAAVLPTYDANAVLRAARAAIEVGKQAETISLASKGVYLAGDEPGRFEQSVDLRSGRYRLDITTGSFRTSEGLDADGAWTAQNGIVSSIDLPGLISEERSRAFLRREGWRDEGIVGEAVGARECDAHIARCVRVRVSGGSPVTIWFDRRTYLPVRAVFLADDGLETTRYMDWRRVDGRAIAFRRTVSDSTGAAVTFKIDTFMVSEVGTNAIARPLPTAHGSLPPSGVARVPFEFTGFDRGHIVVPGVVNGRPIRLILDSGGANYFTPASAQNLGLKVAGGVNIGGVGEGSESGGFALIDSLSIGLARLSDEVAIVGPLPYPAVRPRSGMRVDGLTGYEFLSEFRTTIDYARREVSFEAFDAAPQTGIALPFRSDGNSIYVVAEVEGARGLFRLDSGDGGTLTVFKTFADRHRLFQHGGRTRIQAGGVGGAIATRGFSANTFVLAGTTLRKVPVDVSDTSAGAFSSRTIAGNIGSGILARFKLTLDYRRRTVTFSPNAAVATPFARDWTGLSVTQSTAGALEVLSVAPRSPAALVGLRAGDRIVSVNGHAVQAKSLGVFDLVPFKTQVAPFAVVIERSHRRKRVVIAPSSASIPAS